MKKATVRPIEGKDLPGVDRLRTLIYPHYPEAFNVEFHRSVWRWLGTHPLADEMHRWVIDAEGEIVGHLAATPQYYRINGRRVVAHTPTDYQVLPGYGFQALSLMRTFFRTTENCVACDMVPAVIEVESRMGARVVGDLRYAAKLLDVSRLPVPLVPAPVRRILNLSEQSVPAGRGYADHSGEQARDFQEQIAPPPKRPRAPLPGPVKGALNSGLRAADGALGGAFGGGFRVEVLEEFDASFDDLFEKIAAVIPCVPEKDSAFLNWRYGADAPIAPVRILAARGGGGCLLGYAVVKVTAKGPDKGLDGSILDLTTLPGRHDVVRALLKDIVRYFRRLGVHLIRYRFMASPTSPRSKDLWSMGFFYRKGRNNTLLVKFADGGLHETAVDASNWSYSPGDGEATFWGG